MSGVKPIDVSKSEKYLRTKSSSVSVFNEYLKWEVALLKKFLIDNDLKSVVGVEIGISKNIMVLNNEDNTFDILINPSTLFRSIKILMENIIVKIITVKMQK